MAERSLVERVQTARDNAQANGYDFVAWTVEEIAVDMISYDSDLESESVEDVAAALHVISER